VLLSWYAKCYKKTGTAWSKWNSQLLAYTYHGRRKSGGNSGDAGADPENLLEVRDGVWGERKGLERG